MLNMLCTHFNDLKNSESKKNVVSIGFFFKSRSLEFKNINTKLTADNLNCKDGAKTKFQNTFRSTRQKYKLWILI